VGKSRSLYGSAPAQTEEVIHAKLLGSQIAQIFGARSDLDRCSAADLDTQAPELANLGGIIGDQIDGLDPQVVYHERCGGVVTLVGRMSQSQIRLDGVQPRVLEIVGPQFVGQAYSSALLAQVQEHPPPGAPDHFQRALKLFSAVAA